MKKLFFLFFISVTVNTTAQNETFGIASYTVPKGWKKEIKGDVVTYTITDNKSKTWCVIGIYDTIESRGSSEDDFNSEWQQLVLSKYSGVEALQTAAPVEMDGWYIKNGSSKFSFNKKSTAVTLSTISGYKKCVSITSISNSANYATDIQLFLSSVKLSKPGTVLNNKSKLTQLITSAANFPKAEVWMNVQYQPGSATSFNFDFNSMGKLKPKFYVVYPNGDYYPHFPIEGLNNFSNSNKANDSWGKFTLQGTKGSFVSKYENFSVEKKSSTVMSKTGYTFNFYKTVAVDGLKLEGGWSYIPNWTKDAYYSQPGCRQVIYFKNDGSFDDRGIFVSNCITPDKNPQDAPGKGTYSIGNYTLTLKYTDGRIINKAFTGVADKNPAKENDVLYIGTNAFYKK